MRYEFEHNVKKGPKLLYVIAPIVVAGGLLSWGWNLLNKAPVERPSLEKKVEYVEAGECFKDVNEVKYVVEKVVEDNIIKEKNKKFSYLEVYDDIIEQSVSKLNRKHNKNLDSDLIRAIIITESGDPRHRDNAFKYDPMQIANPGSYAIKVLGNTKEHTNLIGDFSNLKGKRKTQRDKEGELDYSNTNMAAEESIDGGVGWLFHKAAVYNERIVEEEPIKEYEVQSGDNFWKIAKENESTIETLRKYNPKIVPKKIKPGQKLRFKKAKREMYISRWRSWKDAVDRYGDQTKDYMRKTYINLDELKNN